MKRILTRKAGCQRVPPSGQGCKIEEASSFGKEIPRLLVLGLPFCSYQKRCAFMSVKPIPKWIFFGNVPGGQLSISFGVSCHPWSSIALTEKAWFLLCLFWITSSLRDTLHSPCPPPPPNPFLRSSTWEKDWSSLDHIGAAALLAANIKLAIPKKNWLRQLMFQVGGICWTWGRLPWSGINRIFGVINWFQLFLIVRLS